MALTEITDHAEIALGRLLEQFKRKVDIRALLATWIAPFQELEGVYFDLLQDRTLETATGSQLDVLGRIVGEEREGRTDDAYRLGLRARIKLNVSSGTAPEILELMALVLGSSFALELREYFPAAFTLDVHGAVPSTTATAAATVLAQARPAGVAGALVYSEQADADTLTFASGDSEESSTTQGWANDTQTSGGYFADVIGA